MGWAYCGTDSNGRDIGYGVEATCDHPGCNEIIDRGLAYACGGWHGETEYACEKYFCGEHLLGGRLPSGEFVFLCKECREGVEG